MGFEPTIYPVTGDYVNRYTTAAILNLSDFKSGADGWNRSQLSLSLGRDPASSSRHSGTYSGLRFHPTQSCAGSFMSIRVPVDGIEPSSKAYLPAH